MPYAIGNAVLIIFGMMAVLLYALNTVTRSKSWLTS
jgi:hypothetical protein